MEHKGAQEMDQDQLQAEFEEWFSSQHPTSDMRRATGSGSGYINSCVDWAWKGFRGGQMHGYLSHTPDNTKDDLIAKLQAQIEEVEKRISVLTSDGLPVSASEGQPICDIQRMDWLCKKAVYVLEPTVPTSPGRLLFSAASFSAKSNLRKVIDHSGEMGGNVTARLDLLDTNRIDWLETKNVDVRESAESGCPVLFCWAEKGALREQIDYLIKQGA